MSILKGWVATIFCITRTHFPHPDISAHSNSLVVALRTRTSYFVLEHPILFQNILSCLRTSYSILEHPFLFQNILSCFKTSFSVLEHHCVFKNVKKKVEKYQILAILLQKVCKSAIALRTPKKGPDARTSNAHISMHFARTHMCTTANCTCACVHAPFQLTL